MSHELHVKIGLGVSFEPSVWPAKGSGDQDVFSKAGKFTNVFLKAKGIVDDYRLRFEIQYWIHEDKHDWTLLVSENGVFLHPLTTGTGETADPDWKKKWEYVKPLHSNWDEPSKDPIAKMSQLPIRGQKFRIEGEDHNYKKLNHAGGPFDDLHVKYDSSFDDIEVGATGVKGHCSFIFLFVSKETHIEQAEPKGEASLGELEVAF